MTIKKLYTIGHFGLLLGTVLITGCGSSDEGERGSTSTLGTFTFSAEQKFTPSFGSSSYIVKTGDINGDGNDDIILAGSATSSRGQFAVALAKGDGSFRPMEEFTHPNANAVAGSFYLLVGDVDVDGRDDIILMALDNPSQANFLYAAFYKGTSNPEFIYSAKHDLGFGSGSNTFTPRMGQMDGLRGMDILLNNVPNSATNRSYILHAVDTSVSGFNLSANLLYASPVGPLDHTSSGWSGIEYVHLADFDGDGLDDIMWHNLDTTNNAYYVARGTASGLSFDPLHDFGGRWSTYTSLAGDANGDGMADIVLPRQRQLFEKFGIYFGAGTNIDATIILNTLIWNPVDQVADVAIEDLLGTTTTVKPDMFLADVNGDGSKDLIINDNGIINSISNNIAVGLSVLNATGFTYERVVQSVTEQADWSRYETTLIADVNGDKHEDILWIDAAAIFSVYVGIAR